MVVPSPPADGPITSVDEAIARMKALSAAWPAGDGLGCFNHMYLGGHAAVAQRLSRGFFTDPVTMTHLERSARRVGRPSLDWVRRLAGYLWRIAGSE